jgi:excisionase family DNA binding protein
VTIGALARSRGVSVSWIRKLADAGRIPFLRTSGGHRRFDPQAVDAVLRPKPAGSASWDQEFEIAGLREDEVWELLLAELGLSSTEFDPAMRIMHHAFTEMLNNAIDHSEGGRAAVHWRSDPSSHGFRIVDDGVGVYAKVQSSTGLPDLLAAIQELSKGKLTTDPARHSGEGIFFTSKAVDIFRLTSNGLAWTVDNLRADQAIGEDPSAIRGTTVAAEIERSSTRSLSELFDAYTDDDYQFTRTRTWVKLFEFGTRFVSRSEAKRLVHRLEEFAEAILDFEGVAEVGQGFADEVFRVWATAHPDTLLRPVNMNRAVAWMVRRAGGRP